MPQPAVTRTPDTAVEVVLHIGMHKTGTTAFQRWMQQHEAALREMGVLALALPVDLLAGYPDAYDPDAAQRYLAQARAGELNQIVISHETLSQCAVGDFEELRRAFGTAPVRVVLTLRHWCGFLPSRWAQNCRRRDTIPLPDFLEALLTDPGSFDETRPDRVVARAQAGGFDKVEIVSFDASLGQDGPLAALVRACMPTSALALSRQDAEKVNRSLPPLSSEILRLFNAITHEHEGGHGWPMGAGLRINHGGYRRYDHFGAFVRLRRDPTAAFRRLSALVAETMAPLTLLPEQFEALRQPVEERLGPLCVNARGDLFPEVQSKTIDVSRLTAGDLPADLKTRIFDAIA
ncbi:hypothetical protein [Roseovarius aestuariivivens]|uniref:hypothetical protein n=1 Tax=Roseovarius aestuariivivens TaxID=1888910 RepID=UPI0010815D9F|nr:hypothetical protein [Roseovarius aestuariivivens]